LQEEHGLRYIPQQWWEYRCSGDERRHFAQTDGLLLLPARKLCLLLEVKHSHTPESFWQVENLYMPLLGRYLRNSGWGLAAVEICKWFDPQTPFPVRPSLLEDLLSASPGKFSVHILNR